MSKKDNTSVLLEVRMFDTCQCCGNENMYQILRFGSGFVLASDCECNETGELEADCIHSQVFNTYQQAQSFANEWYKACKFEAHVALA